MIEPTMDAAMVAARNDWAMIEESQTLVFISGLIMLYRGTYALPGGTEHHLMLMILGVILQLASGFRVAAFKN